MTIVIGEWILEQGTGSEDKKGMRWQVMKSTLRFCVRTYMVGEVVREVSISCVIKGLDKGSNDQVTFVCHNGCSLIRCPERSYRLSNRHLEFSTESCRPEDNIDTNRSSHILLSSRAWH